MSPNPIPCVLMFVVSSSFPKVLNNLSRLFYSIPIPVSDIDNSTVSLDYFTFALIVIDPSKVNLRAFESKFISIY